jgi:hypothetical protein
MDNVHIAINSNNNNVTTNITTSQTISRTYIISVYTGYGVETNQIDVINTLTDKDKDAIIKSSRLALDKIVELVHLGSTISLKKTYSNQSNEKVCVQIRRPVKNFTKVDKTWLLDDLFEQRSSDLESIYNDLVEEKTIQPDTD